VLCVLSTCALMACGDSDPDDGGAAGAGGGSGTGASGGGGGEGGGEGGTGASGGTGTGGGGGTGGACDPGTGPAPADLPCLDPSEYASFFSVTDPKLCVVAIYESDVSVGFDFTLNFNVAPTWGRHGGPMIVLPTGDGTGAEIVRLTPPATATGTLTAATTTAAGVTTADEYLGSQAIDLPFFNWTLLSFTSDFGTPGGGIVLLEGAAIAEQYPTNGFFAAAALGQPCEPGRVVYTGLRVLGDDTPPGADTTTGVYAADSCGTDGSDERLLPVEGQDDCAAPLAVDLWGNASGPLAADSAGHVVAVSTIYSTEGDPASEVRGFAAKQIERGAPATVGTTLFFTAGFGSSVASLAPVATDTGIVAFQANDTETFEALDVVGQRFSVVSGQLQPAGASSTLFALATPGTAVSMFNDIHGRMWLAANNPTGLASFFVVTRK
jgi:hypothetical protein